jgi:hypothetical protein
LPLSHEQARRLSPVLLLQAFVEWLTQLDDEGSLLSM